MNPRTDPTRRQRTIALVALVLMCAGLTWNLFSPFFEDVTAYGFQDWDAHLSYRALPLLNLQGFGEGPWWHPWLCGGFPSWAYVEGSTNVVSPFSVLYALFPLNLAARMEVVGSTLLALLTSSLLASRFTQRAALCGLVAVVWALNARWALQATVGHTWHLQYAWLPLALYCLDVALVEKRWRFAVGAGAALAMMVFMGGIYPLPHAVLVLGLYAVLIALLSRNFWPLRMLAVCGFTALGFSAPKLFPVLELSLRHPRLMKSVEAITFSDLWVTLTERSQDYGYAPLRLPSWGWHEYGHYIGVVPVLLILLNFPNLRGHREFALRVIGVLLLVLSLGAFSDYAPWTLLHRLPLFASQHVPSRFLFTSVLLLLVITAASLDQLFQRLPWRWWDVALMVPLLAIGVDITEVGRQWTQRAFFLHAPAFTPGPEFRHVEKSPLMFTQTQWRAAPGAYRSNVLAMRANVGVLRCGSVPDFSVGAVSSDGEGYRGEAFITQGDGEASVLRWTPNTAVVQFRDASAGSLLAYNMNFDPGWSVDGLAALEHNGVVATLLPGGTGQVAFSYRPPWLNEGLAVFILTCLALVVALRKWGMGHSISVPGESRPPV